MSARELGRITIENVFHGSPNHFAEFNTALNHSVGIHFGDIDQARYFARSADGQIIKADLAFDNLLDVTGSDLGWENEAVVAFILKIEMMTSVGIIREEFEKIVPAATSLHELLRTTKPISETGAHMIVALLNAHGIDGIKYTNLKEPPGRIGALAYFVLRPEQVINRELV